MSEQIYTAAELQGEGAILIIDYYCDNNTTNSVTRYLYIYMVNIGQSDFNDNNGWISSVSADNLVYEGEVEFPVGSAWKSITLNTPFEYNGTDNLAILVKGNSLYTYSNIYCRTFASSEDEDYHSIIN